MKPNLSLCEEVLAAVNDEEWELKFDVTDKVAAVVVVVDSFVNLDLQGTGKSLQYVYKEFSFDYIFTKKDWANLNGSQSK